MSFSKGSLRTLLRTRFVCLRNNTDGEAHSGSSYAHPPTSVAAPIARGLGEKNLQILMLTPRGRILHTLAGYIGPDDLERELKRALAIWDRVRQTKNPAEARAAVQKAHEEALAEARKRPVTALQTKIQEAEREARERIAALGIPGVTLPRTLVAVGTARDEIDHAFARDHALLPVEKFRPEALVGSHRSFFGASGSKAPEERIGESDAPKR